MDNGQLQDWSQVGRYCLALVAALLALSLWAIPGAAVIPFLLAATTLGVGDIVPFKAPPRSEQAADAAVLGELAPIDTFDPVARAALITSQLPRQWNGTYQAFNGGSVLPVTLKLVSVRALGQMVDLHGEMTVGSVAVPVQGNLNAKSDQLDLLVLATNKVAGLEMGGEFQGLESLALNGWIAPRLTNSGGQLVLNPVQVAGQTPRGVTKSQPVKGLW